MKAAVVTRYGGPEVVILVDMQVPEPGPDELLVRVTATAVTAGDNRLRSGEFPRGFGPIARLGIGVFRPRKHVLGIAYAGVVERVGDRVTGFAPGDRVAGMNAKTLGMHAELATVPQSQAAHIVDGLPADKAAAAMFGGTTALHFLRDRAKLQSGERVLVNGAAGSVGSAAVQLARHFGAHVTAVTSGRNVDLVKRIGAGTVVNYEEVAPASLGAEFDVVVDAVGTLGRDLSLKLAGHEGRALLIAADLFDTVRGGARVITGVAPERQSDFETVMGLVETGGFDPLVNSLGSLNEIVEAHRIAASGRKVGNVVVQPTPEREVSGVDPMASVESGHGTGR